MMSHPHEGHGHTGQAHPAAAPSHPTVKDPVCGMDVTPGQARGGSAEHAETTYWFCSPPCRDKFVANPSKYVAPVPTPPRKQAPEPTAVDGRVYTCPMHPEVRRIGPGSCPKCGMALEPLEPVAEEEPNAELADMTRRFWVSVALTVPLLGLEMGGLAMPELVGRLSAAARLWIQLVLATPVVLWGGWSFFVRGWQSVVMRSLNMFTLIALGTGAAFGYSVFADDHSRQQLAQNRRLADPLHTLARHLGGEPDEHEPQQQLADAHGRPIVPGRSPARTQRRALDLDLRDRSATLHVLDKRAKRGCLDAVLPEAPGELGEDSPTLLAIEVAGEESIRAEPHELHDLDGQHAPLEAPLLMIDHELLAAIARDLAICPRPGIGDESSDLGHGVLSSSE